LRLLTPLEHCLTEENDVPVFCLFSLVEAFLAENTQMFVQTAAEGPLHSCRIHRLLSLISGMPLPFIP
jgi:hypothetical protein